MELVIWKNDSTVNTKVFETYTKGDKKEAIVISSKHTLAHAIKLAWILIKNHNWLLTSAISDKSVEVKVKSNKKYYKAKAKK